jgi:hypothetical protein
MELAILGWVDCFDHQRRLEPFGNIFICRSQAHFYAQAKDLTMVGCL